VKTETLAAAKGGYWFQLVVNPMSLDLTSWSVMSRRIGAKGRNPAKIEWTGIANILAWENNRY